MQLGRIRRRVERRGDLLSRDGPVNGMGEYGRHDKRNMLFGVVFGEVGCHGLECISKCAI